ncbi:hypothetical protein HBI88_194600 [Parastagonospora nodorum]|nr:hypothetical protein HBI97_249540 [Parastagonospora nodorum]KAH5791841.1 hypothetical protein HBI96_201080 [Parastagonospora nodorum]KAH5795091.1 hypothetical protein HBI94_248020 [Parastagonospora nodorum]KAH5815296.1 hypothetical protein HBI93_201650 [Parastagonospora nodorum]KAH5846177.1 hypothetical protein HBI92_245260 [Parastagonospora nodorum]
MIKFCWTKACLLCGAALKSKHSPRIEAQALYTSRCNFFLSLFCPPTRFATLLLKANTTSSNSMSQTNIREGYRITTLEVVKLVEDLTSYLLKSLRLLTLKDWLAVAKCTQLRNAQILKVFYEAAAGTIWTIMLAKMRYNTLTLTLSETAQRRSSSVVSNRSTALITDKFSVALLTEPAILNDANVALVDAVHHSVVIDALTMTLIKDDDDLLGTVNSHIKLRRLGAVMLLLTFQPDELPEQPSPPEQLLLPKKRGRHSKLILDGPPLKRRKTEAADSRHAKASGGRTKKDKDLEDSDTSSDVPRLCRRDRAAARARSAERKRLGKEAQLKKTRDEEELAKAKKEKEEKEARERETQLDSPLDSDDYCLDSSSDIDPEDDSEDEEATTAKDLAREQKERLKALLNANCDFTLYQLTDAYILYFKELLSDNGGIFANAMGMGKTRAIVLAVLIGHVHFKNWTEVQNARAEGDAIEHNVVNDDDKLCPTEGERTFYCACERSPSFNAEPRQAAIMMTSWGRAADAWKNEVCDLSDPLALRFCFFSDSPPENMGRLTKEEVMEMRIDTTDAISKALAAANKLVALRSYVLGGVDHRETVYWIIPEANTPAVHPKATKHCLALLAARFVIVCGFGKVDKHVFRAYNTISVTAQRTIIRKGGPYVKKRAILLPGHVTVWGRTVFDEFHNCKSEGTIMAKFYQDIRSYNYGYQWKAWALCLCLDFLSTVQNAEQQCRDILEKEGLDESEASRRVIFNRFEMQAIASYPALATLKAAYVKDLFTNPSKDHFLVREARAITKSSPKFQNLSNLCSKVKILGTLSRTWSIAAEDAAKAANTLLPLKEVRAKILIGSYKPIVQAVTWLGLREKFGDESVLVMQGAEICVGIVYFNPDSELELKVLGKQDVKTTSRDKLQGGGSTVTDQRMDWHQTELIVISLEALC